MSARFVVVLAAVMALVGCDGGWEERPACPDEGTELTYDTWGRGFIGTHCQTCHASSIDDRKGAPVGISFDTHEEVVEWIDRIYERSAGENVSMPPGPEDPSPEEREKLAEWLACGAP
ncbi:MAG: hypothetical protein HOV80_22885 [Polyangiaceae bacterium]|nr:hypothetical protein [Polyangiaceae bacterium]